MGCGPDLQDADHGPLHGAWDRSFKLKSRVLSFSNRGKHGPAPKPPLKNKNPSLRIREKKGVQVELKRIEKGFRHVSGRKGARLAFNMVSCKDNDELSQQRMEDLMVEAARILLEDEVPETRLKLDAK